MAKEARTARLAGISAGESRDLKNPDTVLVTALVNDRQDKDRPIILELTSQGARLMAARLLEEAAIVEAALGRQAP